MEEDLVRAMGVSFFHLSRDESLNSVLVCGVVSEESEGTLGNFFFLVGGHCVMNSYPQNNERKMLAVS